MLYSFVKYVHPLVLSLGHPGPHPTGPLGSTSRISLKFKSILFLQVPSLLPPHPGPNCRHCHLHTLPGSRLKMLIFFFSPLLSYCNLEPNNESPFHGLGSPMIWPCPLCICILYPVPPYPAVLFTHIQRLHLGCSPLHRILSDWIRSVLHAVSHPSWMPAAEPVISA